MCMDAAQIKRTHQIFMGTNIMLDINTGIYWIMY